MTAEFLGLIYAAGVWIGLLVVGATEAKFFDEKADMAVGCVVFVWPIGLPYLLGRWIRTGRESRAERRRLAEAELRRWLEAPIEEERR